MKFELQIKWNTESAILQVKEAIFEKGKKKKKKKKKKIFPLSKLKFYCKIMLKWTLKCHYQMLCWLCFWDNFFTLASMIIEWSELVSGQMNWCSIQKCVAYLYEYPILMLRWAKRLK